jgi:hypothetical protein
MTLIYKDRVQETTTTTGTGTLILAGAVPGFQSFSAIGNANTCIYALEDANGSGWEVGVGTYTSSGTTLARTTVLASSNSGSAITLSSGTHKVYVTADADIISEIYKIKTGWFRIANSGSGTQSIPDVTVTKLTNSCYTGSAQGKTAWWNNGDLTPDIAGRYLIGASVSVTGTGDSDTLSGAIYKNGGVTGAVGLGTSVLGSGIGTTLSLVPCGIITANGSTDSFSVQAYFDDISGSAAGVTVASERHNNFWCQYLGPST